MSGLQRCDLCDDGKDGPLFLKSRCHSSAPLQARKEGLMLILSCYVPECQKEVARLPLAADVEAVMNKLVAAMESGHYKRTSLMLKDGDYCPKCNIAWPCGEVVEARRLLAQLEPHSPSALRLDPATKTIKRGDKDTGIKPEDADVI